MKKILVSILICFALLCGCFFTACGGGDNKTPTDPPGQQTLPILGAWWWDDALSNAYLDFAKQNNVTEIYYCSDKFNQQTSNFIQQANSKGINVYWLAGEYEWVEHPEWLDTQIQKYLTYQQTYAHKFSGIHLDIEPHQHPNWSSKKAELMQGLAQLAYNLSVEHPTLWIEYDLACNKDTPVLVNGQTKPAYAHIMDYASRVTLMSYRDTAAKVCSFAKDEIDYAKSINKPLVLGVETYSEEGNQVSFMEEGKQIMYQQIEELRTLIPSNWGVAIHQIEQWYNLKD